MAGKRRRAAAPRGVTVKDVAARAGVSTATVSRVVNGNPRVGPEAIRAAVTVAIEELSYVPNPSARSLMTNRTDSIGVVILESADRLFGDPFFGQLMLGISCRAVRARSAARPDAGPDTRGRSQGRALSRLRPCRWHRARGSARRGPTPEAPGPQRPAGGRERPPPGRTDRSASSTPRTGSARRWPSAISSRAADRPSRPSTARWTSPRRAIGWRATAMRSRPLGARSTRHWRRPEPTGRRPRRRP